MLGVRRRTQVTINNMVYLERQVQIQQQLLHQTLRREEHLLPLLHALLLRHPHEDLDEVLASTAFTTSQEFELVSQKLDRWLRAQIADAAKIETSAL